MTLTGNSVPTTTTSQLLPAAFDLPSIVGLSTFLPFGPVDCCYAPTPVILTFELTTLDGATFLNGRTFAFDLLQPAPEPTTLLLFGTTAAALGMARWRQKRRKQQQP